MRSRSVEVQGGHKGNFQADFCTFCARAACFCVRCGIALETGEAELVMWRGAPTMEHGKTSPTNPKP